MSLLQLSLSFVYVLIPLTLKYMCTYLIGYICIYTSLYSLFKIHLSKSMLVLFILKMYFYFVCISVLFSCVSAS